MPATTSSPAPPARTCSSCSRAAPTPSPAAPAQQRPLLLRRHVHTTDSVDGGGGEDSLILGGDYDYTFGALQLVGIERLRLLHDTVGGDFDYTLHMIDANVAAGATLQVNALDLLAGEDLVFDGHFETNGKFVILGGGGNDTLVGGLPGMTTSVAAPATTRIFALAGNDRIAGGLGADVLIGGTGGGTFLYTNAANSAGRGTTCSTSSSRGSTRSTCPDTWAGWATSVARHAQRQAATSTPTSPRR